MISEISEQKSAFQIFGKLTDSELAEKGIVRISRTAFIHVANIDGFDVRTDDGVLFLTVNGIDRQIPAEHAERVLALILASHGLAVAEK